MRDLISEFEPIAKSSNIKIEMTSAPELPKVYSDPFQVLQVLENLLYNAIRYIGFAKAARSKAGSRLSFPPKMAMSCAKWSITASASPRMTKNIFSKNFSAPEMCAATRPAGRGLVCIFRRTSSKDRAAKWDLQLRGQGDDFLVQTAGSSAFGQKTIDQPINH